MAMDVVTIAYQTDCTTQSTRIHFELDIPVPPTKVDDVKSAMDSGDWNTLKSEAKTFAPMAISGALDFLLSVAPQKNKVAAKPKTSDAGTNTGT